MQKYLANHSLMRKKIVYCIPGLHYPGGMERSLTLKANYLASKDNEYEVYIILTEGRDTPPYYELNPHIHLIQLDVNFDDLFTVSTLRKITGYFQKQRIFRRRLTTCLRTIHPDITISLLRREINFFNKINDGSIKIGEIHFSRAHYRNFNTNKLPVFIQKILTQYWMNQLINELKKLKQFVVLTEGDKQKWPEINQISVIPNPLPFYPEKTSQCNNHKVIAVGRYMPEKGFDLLIAAWKSVIQKHPDWTLSIYGDGKLRRQLQTQIHSLELTNNCILEGSVPNIIDKYCESSIFVLSSRYEGFGMVLVEAMACGVAPIAFDCPFGPRDIIQNGKDGFLVEKENIEQLATKINYLIEHEEIRKKMGQTARNNVRRFEIEKIGKQWEQLFEKVLQK